MDSAVYQGGQGQADVAKDLRGVSMIWQHPSKPDACLSTFVNAANEMGLELAPNATVLEIGCAEADWMSIALAHQPSALITGVDVRPCVRPGAVIQGDIFDQDFGKEALDAVVMVSALEHIGLGHYRDPTYANGDRRCMALVSRWLKPDGWVYADVPWCSARSWIQGTKHRIYDDAAIDAVTSLRVRDRRWYRPDGSPFSRKEACEYTDDGETWAYCATLWGHR